MRIASYAIEKQINTWLLIMLCFLGGLWALVSIGRLEDPAFTLKEAVIMTYYPGATAVEVEEEVTELLESGIQQLSQLKRITSKSMPGKSEIRVQIQDKYDGSQMPQIWDELRRKVNDASMRLPAGVMKPIVNDDFGDVFGIFYAVTADGFSDREIRELATFLRREMLTVNGVAKVQTAGEPEEQISVEISQERLLGIGLPLQLVVNTLQTENAVAAAGSVQVGDKRVRLISKPGLDSISAIENLRIGKPGSTEQLSIFDVATVSRGEVEVPTQLIRFNGQPAFTLAISGLTDANIVDVGKAVDRHLASLAERIPLGVTLHPIYQQHLVVDNAINDFIVNLVLSVVIVIAVLCLTMGWRVGLVVGGTLLLTVLGTVFFMKLAHIEMERISLGALIIAMGMLVDNAIVVAETMLINMQRGQSSRQAAGEAASRTQIPLLGATVIGIMAFAGIGLSPDSTGEFLFSLFAVIAISLLLSWVLAISVTPLLAHYLFKVSADSASQDPYAGQFYQRYAGLLRLALRQRALTLGGLALLTLVSVIGFGQVKQVFFPASNTPIFYLNYFLPQGSDIRATSRDLAEIERFVMAQPEVESVSSFIGSGASRFMLTYAPEQPNAAYGQLIIRTAHRDQIPPLMQRLRTELPPRLPQAEIYTQQLMFGPGSGAKLQARVSGPDERILRQLGQQITELMRQDASITDLRQNWRQRELVIVPDFNEERARVAGINRTDLAQTLEFASTGVRSGVFREHDKQIPIVVRPPASERFDIDRLHDRMIWSSSDNTYIPITQVINGLQTQTEEAKIQRRDRLRTLTVEAEPALGYTADQALKRIKAKVEALPLPSGYQLSWGGEYESSAEAQQSLAAQLPLSFIVMLVISILLFGSLKQTLVIWLIVPMSICGVAAGLLASGFPFGFTALLGFLSLSGMLMKNAIVLVDEIDLQSAQKTDKLQAIIEASTSRIRPVILAALTTILGMLPLLWDAFFNSMAVTIMAGLAFATILTLIAVPVLYALVFRVKAQQQS
ncbi:efflux RND transporter permease subunit [Alishewanella jeotgali]|uniref:RND transporter HAE1/HME family, permease n=1 Tax=Alishewanella jeotgali KCTC 22429 TaxID=1129374 RepID=H3ZIB5_9ALTE|nr:efflux RND transporter permease subunit [Alishewanella jeotgali]EHR39757.1 RND transporter HAE1/HME family, permease [Alishewanella jeotgali KCTC 22429]